MTNNTLTLSLLPNHSGFNEVSSYRMTGTQSTNPFLYIDSVINLESRIEDAINNKGLSPLDVLDLSAHCSSFSSNAASFDVRPGASARSCELDYNTLADAIHNLIEKGKISPRLYIKIRGCQSKDMFAILVHNSLRIKQEEDITIQSFGTSIYHRNFVPPLVGGHGSKRQNYEEFLDDTEASGSNRMMFISHTGDATFQPRSVVEFLSSGKYLRSRDSDNNLMLVKGETVTAAQVNKEILLFTLQVMLEDIYYHKNIDSDITEDQIYSLRYLISNILEADTCTTEYITTLFSKSEIEMRPSTISILNKNLREAYSKQSLGLECCPTITLNKCSIIAMYKKNGGSWRKANYLDFKCKSKDDVLTQLRKWQCNNPQGASNATILQCTPDTVTALATPSNGEGGHRPSDGTGLGLGCSHIHGGQASFFGEGEAPSAIASSQPDGVTLQPS